MDKTDIAVAVFNKLAKEYQDKFMDVNLYGDTFDFFCNELSNENARVLDIACGPGNITKYLLNKRADLQIMGIDLAPNMIELAGINNPTATFQVMDCRNIGTMTEEFEGIMCGFCLPYLPKDETEKLIMNAASLLHDGGLIYLSTMEDDYSNSTFKKGSKGDEIFMHFYLAADLEQMLSKNNFKIIKLDRKDYPSPDGTKTIDLVIIAQKQAIGNNLSQTTL
ncbi:class I SAM-dependent methyltransferase [soil metagenome]